MSRHSWILISDLHLKSNYTTWSQNVVLREMVQDIKQRKDAYGEISFVIVSGDLAHGGKPDQYKLVENFLDHLVGVLGLSRADVYMVPGNHDIDRDICDLAFHGTRSQFSNPENVEKYLSNAHERHTLLKRLSAYHKFERHFCKDLVRTFTDDRLAYFSRRMLGSMPVGIIGLNSALACGNDDDDRNIVVGDRPIIDVCEIARNADARLLVGVIHHPPVWLREFDGQTLDRRFLPMCDILHRGHLHEAGVKPILSTPSSKCLVIASGAGYVWRQFPNSYSIVSIDPSTAQCLTTFFEYENRSGKFDVKSEETNELRLRGTIPGTVGDICKTIGELVESATELAPYLAAILAEQVTEIPISLNGRVYFASPNLIAADETTSYAKTAKAFLNVRNALLAFPASTPLPTRMATTIDAIQKFVTEIDQFRRGDTTFAGDLESRVQRASELCSVVMPQSQNSFIASMKQCATESDWEGLEEIARRYMGNDSFDVQASARRHLCLALASSSDLKKQADAVKMAEDLVSLPEASSDDFHLCFSINRNQGHNARAEVLIYDAIDRFSALPPAFVDAALQFSLETGNPNIRIRLSQIDGMTNE